MNNEQYLKQISSKPVAAANKKPNIFLNPTVIAIGVGAIIVIILLVVISNLFGQSEARAHRLTETLYARVSMLSANDGPIAVYSKELSSSSLRALSSNLRTNLVSITRDLEAILPELSIDPKKLSASVITETEEHIGELINTLETARLNALLDRAFSSNITLQIAQLLNIQNEINARTESSVLYDLNHRTMTNLELLEGQFIDFTNSN